MKERKLTIKQEKYAQFRAMGATVTQSNAAAGYLMSKKNMRIQENERNPMIISRIDVLKSELATTDSTLITRQKIVDMCLETYDIAKIQADSTGMRGAIQELNKMHGYYEPEKIVIDATLSMKQVQNQMTQLSDADLLEKMDDDFLPGEFEEI